MPQGLWPQGSGVRIPSLTLLESTTYVLLCRWVGVNYDRTMTFELIPSHFEVGIIRDVIVRIDALGFMAGHLHADGTGHL
jgi:hypothetical protein